MASAQIGDGGDRRSASSSMHDFNKNTSVAIVPLREELTGQVAVLAPDAVRGGRRAVVDRLLQRREPADGSCLVATPRDRAPHVARRRPRRHRPAVARRKPPARDRRRSPRHVSRALDARRRDGVRAGGPGARARGPRRSTGSALRAWRSRSSPVSSSVSPPPSLAAGSVDHRHAARRAGPASRGRRGSGRGSWCRSSR